MQNINEWFSCFSLASADVSASDTTSDIILYVSIHSGAFPYQEPTLTVTLNFTEPYLFRHKIRFLPAGTALTLALTFPPAACDAVLTGLFFFSGV